MHVMDLPALQTDESMLAWDIGTTGLRREQLGTHKN